LNNRHTISYDLEWRNLANVYEGSSKDAVEETDSLQEPLPTQRSNLWTEAGKSASSTLKSAVSWIYRLDKRNDASDPWRGYFLRTATV
jgi:outer membrane protein assembly factor BamA